MPGKNEEKYVMKCPRCKVEVYPVKGCPSYEPDGIRGEYWCDECSVMYTCHKHGLVPRLKLKDYYAPSDKKAIESSLENAINSMQILLNRVRKDDEQA